MLGIGGNLQHIQVLGVNVGYWGLICNIFRYWGLMCNIFRYWGVNVQPYSVFNVQHVQGLGVNLQILGGSDSR